MLQDFVAYLSENSTILGLIVAIVGLVVAAVSLFISIIVLVLTYKSWKLKSGSSVIGGYGTTSSITTSHTYISEICLHNLKDKEFAINQIYVRFGTNVYIDMLEKDSRYDKYNIVLPPFGTAVFNFGPVYLYSDGQKKVDVEELFNKQGTIVLGTNHGKVVVSNFEKGWSPISDWFDNFGTEVIYANRFYKRESIYREGKMPATVYDFTSFGDKYLYIVTLELKDGQLVEYPIMHWKERQVVKFEKLKFTKENLESIKTLKAFLNKSQSSGVIDFVKIHDIIDVKSRIKESIKNIDQESYKAKAEGWLEYKILDKIQTWWWKFCETKPVRRWLSHYNRK